MNDHLRKQRPEILFEPRWWVVCSVKILIVTDASGGFGPTAGFHLGHILDVLADDPWSPIRFDLTKAHRQTEATADVPNFRFDTHDLTSYSQIWLFGIDRTLDPLSPEELRALTQFMDAGGGVFATGDHENLGVPVCGEVPRVRSMRRWHWPSPGPAGEPVAPDQTGSERHDTVMDTSAAAGLQGSQSDEVPQPIRPRYYSRKSGSGIVHRVHKFPHPLLCGPAGVIAYLPDHMHEGLCEVPADLTRSYTFAGYTTREYPDVAGAPLAPEVIAWATSRNTDGHEFGVLAAYDGHRAGIGRVAVDATWHHWFNINLVGFVDATTPGSASYDASVVPKWESIKAYFRNVAVWLARPSLQSSIRNGRFLIAVGYYDALITYRDIRKIEQPLAYYHQLGVYARDALGRLASRCETVKFTIEMLEWLELRIDPWPPFPVPLPDPPPWLDLDELEVIALGGALHAVHEQFGKDQAIQDVLDKLSKEVSAVARQGASIAVATWAAHHQAAAEPLHKLEQLARRQAQADRVEASKAAPHP